MGAVQTREHVVDVVAVEPAGAELDRLGDHRIARMLASIGEHGYQLVTLDDGEPRFAIVGQEHMASFIFLWHMHVHSPRMPIVFP